MPAKTSLDITSLQCGADIDLLLEQATQGRGADLNQVRGLVRDFWYTLETTEIGTVRIAARVVAALARDRARMIPGVQVGLRDVRVNVSIDDVLDDDDAG